MGTHVGIKRTLDFAHGLGMTALVVLLVVTSFLFRFVRQYRVDRGRPFFPWLRASEDERWDRRETGLFALIMVVLSGLLGVLFAGFVVGEEPTLIGVLAWLETVIFISLVVATAVVRVIHDQRHTAARDGSGQAYQPSVRITIPGAGVALSVPRGWQSLEGDMAASASGTSGSSGSSGSSASVTGDDPVGTVHPADVKVLLLAWRGEDGLKLQVEPTRLAAPEAVDTGTRDERGPTLDDGPSVDHIAIPAGRATRVRTSSESKGRTIVSTRYAVVRREWTYSLVFASPNPPEDRWLSIAETLHLPVEE